MTDFQRKTTVVDGLVTSYLEAGEGDPVVLLHGGEFGAGAELGWERNIAALAARYRVLAPDMLGYGQSAKVIDFVDGRGHADSACGTLLRDARRIGRPISSATRWAPSTCSTTPRRTRRYCRSEAWLSSAAAERSSKTSTLRPCRSTTRLCRPCSGSSRRCSTAPVIRPTRSTWAGATSPAPRPGRGRRWLRPAFAARARRGPPTPSSARAYERITVPTLVIEGGNDKLLPSGWSAEIAEQIDGARSVVIDDAGHCPQIEQSSVVNVLLLDFLSTLDGCQKR